MRNKKGISVWVSYVLLTALVVSLGILVLNWSKETTISTVDDIVERGDTITLCANTGIEISNLCQDTQTLNMDVTNTNTVQIEGIWASMFTIRNEPHVSSRNLSILPHKSKTISVLKQGIVKKVELSPIIESKGLRIKCLSQLQDFEEIPACT